MTAAEGRDEDLRQRLAGDVLPSLAAWPGIVAVHLLESAVPAALTAEQRIRGNDADLRFALMATGYDGAEISRLLAAELTPQRLQALGAAGTSLVAGAYRLGATLTAGDLSRGG